MAINWRGYRDPVNKYHPHCCGEKDCPTIDKADMKETLAGWLIVPTGEVVPYAETYASEDGLFYRCHMPTGERRCFFAPETSS